MKLLLKLSIFMALLISIKLVSAYFNTDELTYRRSRFAEAEFNTVFIGSSRTKFAVIPAYFDELTNYQTRSYNFGISAALPPETLELSEELIKSKPTLNHIFVELAGESKDFRGVPPAWQTFSFYDYIKSVQSLGFYESSKYHDKLAVILLRPNTRGNFSDYNLPLPAALEDRNLVENKKIPDGQLQSLKERDSLLESGKISPSSFNQGYWERICRLIEIAEARQIRIYFFLPQRLESQKELDTVYPIYQRLEPKYKLNPPRRPDLFYRDEMSADLMHLNHQGAIQFTAYLADAFNQKN